MYLYYVPLSVCIFHFSKDMHTYGSSTCRLYVCGGARLTQFIVPPAFVGSLLTISNNPPAILMHFIQTL